MGNPPTLIISLKNSRVANLYHVTSPCEIKIGRLAILDPSQMSRQSSEEESSRKFAEFNLVVNITNQNIGGQKSRSASRKSKRGNNVDNNLKYVRITVFSRQIVIKD